MITVAEKESDIRITKDTPYLALTGELWGVYCEGLGENGPRYNGTALYWHNGSSHWGPLYASMNWVISGSNNDWLPICCQAITWTNDELLSNWPLGTNFSVIWIKIEQSSYNKMNMKISAKLMAIVSRPQCVWASCIKIKSPIRIFFEARLWLCFHDQHHHFGIALYTITDHGIYSLQDDTDSGYHTGDSTLKGKAEKANKTPGEETLSREELRRKIDAFNDNQHGLLMSLVSSLLWLILGPVLIIKQSIFKNTPNKHLIACQWRKAMGFILWVESLTLCCILVIVVICKIDHIDGLVHDCSKSSANALELLQSCTEPSI